MSFCKYCGREIMWLDRPNERAVAVDPEPVFVIEGDGYERFLQDEGDEAEIVGRVARPEEVQTREQKINTPLGWVPHWKTCGRGR